MFKNQEYILLFKKEISLRLFIIYCLLLVVYLNASNRFEEFEKLLKEENRKIAIEIEKHNEHSALSDRIDYLGDGTRDGITYEEGKGLYPYTYHGYEYAFDGRFWKYATPWRNGQVLRLYAGEVKDTEDMSLYESDKNSQDISMNFLRVSVTSTSGIFPLLYNFFEIEVYITMMDAIYLNVPQSQFRYNNDANLEYVNMEFLTPHIKAMFVPFNALRLFALVEYPWLSIGGHVIREGENTGRGVEMKSFIPRIYFGATYGF